MNRVTYSFLTLAFFLAGCSVNPLEVTISRCPAVAIVGDTGVLTAFNGDEQSVDDIAYEATILDVDIDCSEGDQVRALVSFDIGVSRGPASAVDTVTLPYFVVVLKDNNAIVSKQSFSTTLAFDREGRTTGREVVSQLIPTIEQARRYNYEVLIGFELDPADIAYNMRR